MSSGTSEETLQKQLLLLSWDCAHCYGQAVFCRVLCAAPMTQVWMKSQTWPGDPEAGSCLLAENLRVLRAGELSNLVGSGSLQGDVAAP